MPIKFDDSHKKFVADCIALSMRPDAIKTQLQKEFSELDVVGDRAMFLFISQVGKSAKWKHYINSIRADYGGEGKLTVDLLSPKSRLEICQKIVKDELDKGADGDSDKIATFLKLGATDAERIAQSEGSIVTYEDFIRLIMEKIELTKKTLGGRGAIVT